MSHMHTHTHTHTYVLMQVNCKLYTSKLSLQIILRQQSVVHISTAFMNVSASNRSHFCEFYAFFPSYPCFYLHLI